MPSEPVSLHRLSKADPTMWAGGNKSEGDAGELFGETGLAAGTPYSRREHIFDAGESTFDLPFSGVSLHVFNDSHGLQSYADSHERAIL
jgi:hypothetical protein